MQDHDLQASFGRCCVKKGFFDRFYELFLASNPAIGPMFDGTDMTKQKGLLRTGLTMLLMYAAGGNTLAESTVERLGKTHGHKGMNISPRMYPHWTNSLLQAVRESDPHLTPALERAWSEALQKGIDRMVALYESDAA